MLTDIKGNALTALMLWVTFSWHIFDPRSYLSARETIKTPFSLITFDGFGPCFNRASLMANTQRYVLGSRIVVGVYKHTCYFRSCMCKVQTGWVKVNMDWRVWWLINSDSDITLKHLCQSQGGKKTVAQQMEKCISRKSYCCLDGAEQHSVNAQHHKSAARGRWCGFFFNSLLRRW